jgi:hypothetical protein
MRWFDWLLGIDRRWIFLLVFLAVGIPFFFPMGLPVIVTPPVESLYNAVDAIGDESGPLLLSMDYAPATTPELDPMSIAILRHAFSRRTPVIVITLHPAGYGLAQRAITAAVEGTDVEYGTGYVFLGFQPGIAAAMMGMGIDISNIFPDDAYGTPISDIPLMEGIRNYEDIPLLISIAGSAYPDSWVAYTHEAYGQQVGAGVTAVMATDYYPYLNTGQLVGLLGGMRGAAEYEVLIDRHDKGVRGMDSQSVIHVLILVLIAAGNLAYLFQRRARRLAEQQA